MYLPHTCMNLKNTIFHILAEDITITTQIYVKGKLRQKLRPELQ